MSLGTIVYGLQWGVQYLFPLPKGAQHLEPLSTLMRLAILSKKPIGTKPSIINNSMGLDEPSYDQGLKRGKVGHEDVGYLSTPIGRACEWWGYELDKDLEVFFADAESGIKNLRVTYSKYTGTTLDGCLEGYECKIRNIVKLYKGDLHEEPTEMVALAKKIKELWPKALIKAANTHYTCGQYETLNKMLDEQEARYVGILREEKII
jgi:hypothetical protein